MKIGNRINARKVVLSYFYQYCFFYNLGKQKTFFSNVLSVQNIFENQGEGFEQAKIELETKINRYLKINIDEDIDYFISIFFDKRKTEDIDMDYIFQICSNLENYYSETKKQVDIHTQSFSFLEMGIVNQAIFLLGYIERKVLKTPKEILLNELIELSKRYDYEGSPKLINGIMHKIVD